MMRDSNFRDMVNRVQEEYEFLSENEISDLCYFIRRMSTIGLNRIFSMDFRHNLRQKIQALIDSSRADIKFLATTYFDLALANYNVDYIARPLSMMIQKMEEDNLD